MSVPGARRGALPRRPPMKRDAETLSSRCLTLGVLLAVLSPVALSAPAPPPAASPSQVQFGGQCAEALAEGQHVQTNCTVTWTTRHDFTLRLADRNTLRLQHLDDDHWLATPQAERQS